MEAQASALRGTGVYEAAPGGGPLFSFQETCQEPLCVSSHCLGPSYPLYMGWFMSAPQPREEANTRAAEQLSGLSVLSWDTIVSPSISHKEP